MAPSGSRGAEKGARVSRTDARGQFQSLGMASVFFWVTSEL